jgi:hypothetical protein
MVAIGTAVAENLNRLAAGEQRGRQVAAPAQYQRSDFVPVRNPRTGKPGSYRNIHISEGQPGHIVGRRQHDKLIGRPLPSRTRAQARARVAQRIGRQGLNVTAFSGLVRTLSGRDRRTERYRQMRDETSVPPDRLEQMLDLWLAGEDERAGLAFNDAFIGEWWNGGAGEISDVDELDFDFGEEGG